MAIRALFLGLLLSFVAAFVGSVSPYWFNPLFTTDDALQQTFPLYEALYPGVFQGDLVTTAMVGYLPPLHYWLSWGITRLTVDPNIAGHWVMLIQLVLCLSFLFFAVRQIAPLPVALFSLFWFLHTRNLVQRMTLGIPRGWGGVIICAFLYFLLSRKHWGVIVVLACGTLLNPPATFLCGVTYGLYLCYAVFISQTERRRALTRYILCAPLIVLLAFYSTSRPPEIGKMVSLEEAQANPAFDRSGGRFAFLPFKSPKREIETIGMQAFVNRWYQPPEWLERNIFWFVSGAFILFLGCQFCFRRELFPTPLLIYLISIITVYLLSRELAFKLYVPDRHLQYPLNLFFIIAFPAALWRLFYRGTNLVHGVTTLRSSFLSSVALLLLGAGLFYSGGSGLEGSANFNTRTDMLAGIHSFLKANTPQGSVIAGHPSHLNGVPLFALRRAFMTTEAAHPFYDRYYVEVKRRLELTFRAYYATNLKEFSSPLENERIDYFVFRNMDFTPERLKKAGYDKPLKDFVRRLATKYPSERYLFNRLPTALDSDRYPFLVYRDAESTIIDINKLREYLSKHPDSA